METTKLKDLNDYYLPDVKTERRRLRNERKMTRAFNSALNSLVDAVRSVYDTDMSNFTQILLRLLCGYRTVKPGVYESRRYKITIEYSDAHKAEQERDQKLAKAYAQTEYAMRNRIGPQQGPPTAYDPNKARLTGLYGNMWY